jgi:hypothetical protein
VNFILSFRVSRFAADDLTRRATQTDALQLYGRGLVRFELKQGIN